MQAASRTAFRTSQITKIAILSALAGLLMYVEFSVPFVPPFLKLDISEIPALIGAFALGPVSGIIIELIKNLIHLPVTSSLGVGEIANFIVGSVFVGSAGLIYRRRRTKSGALIAMLTGTLCMAAVASLSNYFFLIDFYAKLFHVSIDEIVKMTTKVNALVKDFKALIVFAFLPFNIFKGLLVSLVTVLLYKRVSPILHRK